jgi:hypothetical protein
MGEGLKKIVEEITEDNDIGDRIEFARSSVLNDGQEENFKEL